MRPSGPPAWPGPQPELIQNLLPWLTSGVWGNYHGPQAAELSERLQSRFGCLGVFLCASGTAAVELALRGCRVSAGDEVILAGYDFLANFRNILLLGGIPRLVDIRADDAQLDVEQVAAAIGPRTKALIASHLHGGIVDMPRLRKEAERQGLLLIEDACQALGGSLEGRPLGSWGDVAVLSFGGSKLLSAGRGGAVLAYRAEIAQRIKLYQQRGNEAYPLSELQAGILLPQLDRLDAQHELRESRVRHLSRLLEGLPGLRMLRVPFKEASPAYYKVGLWYEPATCGGLSRDQFAAALQAEGFAVYPGFDALHRCHARGRYQADRILEHAARAGDSLLVLHHPLLLEPPEGVEGLVFAVHKIIRYADALREVVPPASLRDNDEL